MIKKILRLLGVLLGAFLIWKIFHQVGWTSIVDTLGLLRWSYLVIITYPLLWILPNTLGWRSAIHSEYLPRISFWNQFRVRVAGETFNALLPSGYVGGEPLKAKFLSAWLPLREATSSVLIAKAAQSLGMVAFIGLGLTLAHPAGRVYLHRPLPLAALLFLTVGICVFIWLLAHQSFSRLIRFLQRWKGRSWFQAWEPRLAALDDSLGTFYREGKGQFFTSVFWHLVGWAAGSLELMVIFYLIGHPILWRQAWFMGSIAQLSAIMGLLSPASVGFFEGGHYAAAVLLGLPPSLGVSVSLIRRVREVFWDIVGFFFFWRLSNL